MGYVTSDEITKDLDMVCSDGECSLHISDDKLEETKIIRPTHEEWAHLFGCWVSELSDEERTKYLAQVQSYEQRVMDMQMLLADAQFYLEEDVKGAEDEERKQGLQEWQKRYKDITG